MRKILIWGRWGTLGRNMVLNGIPFPADEVYVVSSSSANSLYEGESLEKASGMRSEDCGDISHAIQKLKDGDKSVPEIWVLPFSQPDFTLSGCNYLQVSRQTAKYCESKRNFVDILEKSNVDQCYRAIYYDMSQPLNYSSIVQTIGTPFVLQEDSKGGRGTHLIDSQESFSAIIPQRIDRICSYIEGDVFNCNLLTLPSINGLCDIFVEVPSFKPMNILSLSPRPFSSCGNEWGRYALLNFSSFLQNMLRIGEYLYQKVGLKGLWGIDFIYNQKNSAYKFIEINARLQGTTEVATICQILRVGKAFLFDHCAVLSGQLPPSFCFPEGYNQNTIRYAREGMDRSPFYIKLKADKDVLFRPSKNFMGNGIYCFKEGHLEWKHCSLNTLDADLQNGELLISNAPESEILIKKGIEICMIEGMRQRGMGYIFQDDQKLSSLGETVLRSVKTLLCL